MRSLASAALAFTAALFSLNLSAQSSKQAPVWQLQPSGTDAGLRGIDSVNGSIAWASGSEGTILRTTDGGAHWTRCATPDAAKDGATLDFRGIQAWDANTAIVMASGPGDKSRLYKTTNGCRKWKLILKNRDKSGFWDALYFPDRHRKGWSQDGWLLGDPVNGHFTLLASFDGGKSWNLQRNSGLEVPENAQSAFAASNSSLIVLGYFVWFGSGGTGGAFIYSGNQSQICVDDCPTPWDPEGKKYIWKRIPAPLGNRSNSSGIFSMGFRDSRRPYTEAMLHGGGGGFALPNLALIAVGGDYTKPNLSTGTAAYSTDGGLHWTASTTPPHGFRSAVQYSAALHAWLTVGTNGSDISRDDGRTWQPLDNGNWNALSLPFVVGPKGRIARLNPSAIPSP